MWFEDGLGIIYLILLLDEQSTLPLYDPEAKEAVEVVLIDLQIMRAACLSLELASCFFSSTSTKFRERYLHEMMQLYADEFGSHCDVLGVEYLPGFSYDTVQRRFHRAKVMGAVMGIQFLPIVLKDALDAPDMENFTQEKDLSEMIISEMATRPTEQLKERLHELIKELHNEGVI